MRPAVATDEPFLRYLDADRRADVLDAAPGPVARAILADIQYRAQERGYRAAFPIATDHVVLVDDEPAGRLLISSGPAAHCVVDLALLRSHRGRGVGTALLREVQAAAAGVPVELTVVGGDSRLVGWYERLGFRMASAGEVHLQMSWAAPGGLARFGALVVADPDLQAQLLGASRADFVALVVRLARDRGLEVHPAEVEDALVARRRAWYSAPWI